MTTAPLAYTDRLLQDALALIAADFRGRAFVPGDLTAGLRVRGHRGRTISQPVLEAACNALVAQGHIAYHPRKGFELSPSKDKSNSKEEQQS